MTSDRDWVALFERAAPYGVTVADVERALSDRRADDAGDGEDDAAE